jgi:hypothetical protein
MEGKVQTLQESSFGTAKLFTGHQNPQAEVTSTIAAYQKHTACSMYEGADYFWGIAPQQNETITIKFTKPFTLSRYYFHSGNAEHPADKCRHAAIEVRYAQKTTTNNYVRIGEFDRFGEAQSSSAVTKALLGELSTLRIVITKAHANWIIINEMLIA